MTDTVEFVKIHGIGNDFILVHTNDLPTEPRLALALCDRHRGVGADGVLFFNHQPPRMEVLNADGTRPEMCGNGLRCVALWLVKHYGLPRVLEILTDAGPRRCEVDLDTQSVTIDMGVTQLSSEVDVIVEGVVLRGVHVNVGNPHFVVLGSPGLEEVDRIGSILNQGHPEFPQGVNIEFVQDVGELLEVVVFERGVGRTEACGTGACAVAAVAWEQGRRSGHVHVKLPGGTLEIERRGTRVWMTGPTELVYRGAVDRKWLAERHAQLNIESE